MTTEKKRDPNQNLQCKNYGVKTIEKFFKLVGCLKDFKLRNGFNKRFNNSTSNSFSNNNSERSFSSNNVTSNISILLMVALLFLILLLLVLGLSPGTNSPSFFNIPMKNNFWMK